MSSDIPTGPEQEMRRKLDNLGAWRLLQHFKGDWKAAQNYTAQARGKDGPLFRGKKAWLRAAAEAEREMQAHVLTPGSDCLDHELRTNPRFRSLFPGVFCAKDLPAWAALSDQQRQAVTAVFENSARNRNQ